MKLTWFGGTTLRIHIGGEILVCDADGAPAGIDAAELTSGADRVFGVGDALGPVDLAAWQPRRATELAEDSAVRVLRAGDAVLVDALGEAPLLLVAKTLDRGGRWGRDAVAVVFSADAARAALEALQPRLIAVAAGEEAVHATFLALRARLGGTVLVALEPGLALEA
jgi:hypothetical protein